MNGRAGKGSPGAEEQAREARAGGEVGGRDALVCVHVYRGGSLIQITSAHEVKGRGVSNPGNRGKSGKS